MNNGISSKLYLQFFNQLKLPYKQGIIRNPKNLLSIESDLKEIKDYVKENGIESYNKKYFLLRDHKYHFSDKQKIKRKQQRFLEDLLNLIEEVDFHQKQARQVAQFNREEVH